MKESGFRNVVNAVDDKKRIKTGLIPVVKKEVISKRTGVSHGKKIKIRSPEGVVFFLFGPASAPVHCLSGVLGHPFSEQVRAHAKRPLAVTGLFFLRRFDENTERQDPDKKYEDCYERNAFSHKW